jgi:hypothetical protein
MAKPIESTTLNRHDFELLVRDLENPKLSPQGQAMYEAGKLIHERYHRKN